MFDNEHFIRSPLLLRVDTHIARFAGYSQSSETTRNGPADLEVESGYIAKDSPLRGDGLVEINSRRGAGHEPYPHGAPSS